MSYVEKNLMPGETVVYRAQLHWTIYLPAIFMGAFSLVMCIVPLFGILLFLLLVFIRRTSLEVLLTKVEGIMVDQGYSGTHA